MSVLGTPSVGMRYGREEHPCAALCLSIANPNRARARRCWRAVTASVLVEAA